MYAALGRSNKNIEYHVRSTCKRALHCFIYKQLSILQIVIYSRNTQQFGQSSKVASGEIKL